MSTYYFDHAASAPRRDEVFDAMAPYLHGVVGNPSGMHRAARASRRAIEEAREEVASFVGVEPGGVIFTGGGTESCNLAIGGVVHHFRRTRGEAHVIVSPTEHHAVLGPAEDLSRDFADVEMRTLRVDSDGVVDLDSLSESLCERSAIVSVMTANNETGVLQPVSEIGDLVRELAPHCVTHTDAVAGAPWLALDQVTASTDLITICAHKLGGPVNAGALIMRRSVGLDPLVSGGGQERGRRGGTVDVAAAVGLAAAVRVVAQERAESVAATRQRQIRLERALTAIEGVELTAANARRLPGHVHVTIAGLASDEMLFLLDQEGVCASAASSCSSGAAIASHVLAAMRVSPEQARGALRFTMGTETTDDDVSRLIAALTTVVGRLRTGS